MGDNVEKQKTASAQAELVKTPEQRIPATPEHDEIGLDRMIEKADSEIESNFLDIVSTADKRIESAPVSVGLNKQKAESIFTSGGFAERLKSAKDRIGELAKSTKAKIGGLTSQKIERRQEFQRPKTLDQYMAEHQRFGLEAVKEKARLAQLKLQGIKNPERVLALAHYLEEVAVETDSKHLKLEKTETVKIEEESEKLRARGFEVSVNEHYSDDTKMGVYATKETAYSFKAGESKWLAKDLDQMVESPNDAVQMFEMLRESGYNLNIRKGWTFADNDTLKEFFKNPDVLPLLEKLKTFAGNFVTHDYLKGGYAFSRISELATKDATEHILTPEAEKGIEKVSALLGKPISSANLETWLQLSQDETVLKVFAILQKVDKGTVSNEQDWIYKLSTIKNAGIEKDVLALLQDGFQERSLGKLYGYGDVRSEWAAKDIHAATEAFERNPQLHELVRGVVGVFGIEDPMSRENMQKFQQLVEKFPTAGSVFANLAEIGLRTEGWELYRFLGNPEESGMTKDVLEAMAESDFKTFASDCKRVGYQFTLKDFFDPHRQNRLILSYNDPGFRSAIASEMGTALAKHLGVFEVPSAQWNRWALSELARIPDSISMLQQLNQNYGYTYNPNDDYGNYHLSSLMRVLKNPEICNKLFNPQTIQSLKIINGELGVKFSLDGAEDMLNMIERPDFRAALQDPETLAFVKKGLKETNVNLRTAAALAKCDLTLRPAIEKMVEEFEYVPEGTYVSVREYVSETGEYVNAYELVLTNSDIERFRMLRDNPQIFEAQQRLEAIGMKRNPLTDMKSLMTVSENDLFSIFEQYSKSEKLQKFLWDNLDTTVIMSRLPEEKSSMYLEIFQKIDDSPSQEIQRLKDSLLSQLLESQHPAEDYQKIESIFIKNNIPTMGKVYGVFETLYGPKKLEQKIAQHTSPVLQQASSRKRYYTIYQDMLKVHIESGNRSMKEYAEVLQRGGGLIDQYERDGLESLNSRQQEELRYFVGKLETLQAKSALDTADNAFKAVDLSDLELRLDHVRQGLKVAEGQSVLDRVSDMYLRPAGLKSLDELLARMRNSKNSADQRGRLMVSEARQKTGSGETLLELEAGDFLKGIDIRHIGNILQNGSVAKEFLGASSDSDLTPLDTDISLITSEDAEGGFTNSVNNSLAKKYGEVMFVLKDRGQYQRTTAGQPAAAEAGKMELFMTGVLGERHYGIRTGFPTTEIDFMIAKEDLASRPKDLQKLFFEIAQNGYYTPIADTSGKVIFTPEIYDEYRESFAGLEKFDAPPLDYHPTTTQERSYDQIAEIAAAIPEDSRRVDQSARVIRDEIEQVLGGLGVSLRPEFDTSIVGAELMDTGSTGRHTNTPGDFDFDFSLKLDAKDFPRSAELAQAIKGMMVFTKDDSHQEDGGYYQLRVKGVTSIRGQQLDKPLDIDIGFASKSDLSVYGSHDAIRDKLNYIKLHNGQEAYEQTVANVILTKQILKEGHAYKKQEDGGFGGVGVENWILAHGGNMEDAFKDFRDAAYENGQRLPYEKFKDKYRILDPGTNIKFQSHDNFIAVLKPTGYEAMLSTIENYFGQKAERSNTRSLV